MNCLNELSYSLGGEECARLPEDREEPELVGVVGGRGGEDVEIGGEEVRAGAARAPGGEAGRDALFRLDVADGLLQRGRVVAVEEDAGVGGLELVLDARAAAWHHGWLGLETAGFYD